MDDGYSIRVQTRPQSPGYDIGPDEDRNCAPAQNFSSGYNCADNGERENWREMFLQDGMFTECLDETPSRFTDITDMPNTSLNTSYEALYHEVNRRKTFDGNWNVNYFVQPNDLARNGFFYFGPDDKVKCVFCLKTLWRWEQGDSVEGEHQKHYPNCPFVRGNCDHLNVPIGSFETSLGLHIKKKEQNFPPPVNYTDRLRSYQGWSKHDVVRPEALAEAGLYFLGEEDQVKCFSCQKVLSNWNPDDDPWFEHAKCSPGCQYVQSVKGTEFIDKTCSSQPSLDRNRPRRSVAGELVNAVGSEPVVATADREDSINYRSQEAELVPDGPDLAAQIENDMKTPIVIAVMTTCEISVEKMRERLAEIKLTQGPDYTVTSKDFTDLMN